MFTSTLHKFLILAVFIVTQTLAFAQTTHVCGTDGVDNSCTVAGITSLISSASTGDTIRIATGTHSWSSYPTINKALTITGSTVCTRNASTYEVSCVDGSIINSTSSFFYIEADNIKITNLTLIGDGGDIAFPFSGSYQLNLLVEGNRISYVYKMITKTGTCRQRNMVFAGNKIEDCGDECFYFIGSCIESWEQGGNLGNDYPEGTLYLEDNHITWPTPIDTRNLMEAGGGGRYTVRHNKIVESSSFGVSWEGVFGTHGHCYAYRDENTNTGTYGVEIHDNKITAATLYKHLVTVTGGRGYAYNNDVGGIAQSWNEIAALHQEWGTVGCNDLPESSRLSEYIRMPQYWECNAGGTTPSDYPCPLQAKDWYVWNNTVVSGQFTIDIRNTNNWSTDYFLANRDFWTDYNSTFNTGLNANRGNSCTTHNAYWSTDTKQLYRCTSTDNYELIYTTYTYPHPLRGESTPELTIPQGVHIGGGIEIK